MLERFEELDLDTPEELRDEFERFTFPDERLLEDLVRLYELFEEELLDGV